ncbi:MAG: hypothetical protein GDA50_03475 [Alphaproteobacteria bacterium GM202ARS2]|nr:hypothetical protein [Alphaproteobacteria bacterium GM202ARS2]
MTMRFPLSFLVLVLAVVSLGSCGKEMRQAVGIDKPEIDSDVTRVPPLTLPPEFTLRPPKDGSAPTAKQIKRSQRAQKRPKRAARRSATEKQQQRRSTIPTYRDADTQHIPQDCKKVVLDSNGQYVCEDS